MRIVAGNKVGMILYISYSVCIEAVGADVVDIEWVEVEYVFSIILLYISDKVTKFAVSVLTEGVSVPAKTTPPITRVAPRMYERRCLKKFENFNTITLLILNYKRI